MNDPLQPHTGSDFELLQGTISTSRFAPYLATAENAPALAARLYQWNLDLSAALFTDIAVLEVALRNSMHESATSAWGPHWYSNPDVGLDDRTQRQFASAWKQLPKRVTDNSATSDVPGRFVAQCTFGVWANLLDEGGYQGTAPRRFRTKYDSLWQEAFKYAFPGGRLEAKAIRDHSPALRGPRAEFPAFTREWTYRVAKVVNDLRNRVAHHETLVNGFPLTGQTQRLSAEEGYEHCLTLARSLDRDLASWLAANSSVPEVLRNRPRAN